MKITVTMVILYILYCIRIGTKPCKYFQLNSPCFDRHEGIFSKLDIDQYIPQEWRLEQRYDDGEVVPEYWPVFVKPEWGQNAAGVERADSPQDLTEIRKRTKNERVKFLLQQAAPESREFEIFSMRHYHDQNNYAVLTVTEAVNESEPNPINGIYNPSTKYVEITEQFDSTQIGQLWQHVNRIGHFNISRASVRANSLEDLMVGRFHVIEVNLFLPMPINMLDRRYGLKQILDMIRRYMMSLARITKARDKSLPEKPVFTKIMLYNRESRLLNFLRAKI
ncbi:MAG: hypothetical protein WBM41_04245 [Arenicellales bacterium]